MQLNLARRSLPVNLSHIRLRFIVWGVGAFMLCLTPWLGISFGTVLQRLGSIVWTLVGEPGELKLAFCAECSVGEGVTLGCVFVVGNVGVKY